MSTFSSPLFQICRRPPVMGVAFVFLTVMISVIVGTRSFLPLFSLEGLLIVAGGVIAVAYMSFPVEDVKRALHAIAKVFDKPDTAQDNLHYDMMKIVAWAAVTKEYGMASLEKNISKSGLDDPFVKYGLNMVVSNYKPSEVRAMMETASDACFERDSAPLDVLHAMASHAPAFGMIGTLVGMVSMLGHMSGDIASIGSTLAVAFLSTLYGVMSARLAYMPAAARLQKEIDGRRFRHHLITEGMVMLVSNKTPMYIQDKLNSFLRPESRNYFDSFNTESKRPVLKAVPAKAPPAKIAQPVTPPLLKVVGA